MNKPSLFNKSNGVTREAAIHCLEEYSSKIKWVKEGGRIIDLGCADGSVTSIMRKYVPSNYVAFVACDINETMIKYAKESCADDTITFRVLDAEGDLPVDLSGFNHVFSFFLFHWIRNQAKAFNNIYELLTVGGDCLVTILKSTPIYEIYEHMARNSKWGSSWLSDVNNFLSPYYYEENAVKQIKCILQGIGFINIEIQFKQMKYILSDGMELKNLIRAVEPYSMPNEVFEEFLQDTVPFAQHLGLLDKTDKNYDVRKTPIDFNYTLIVVYAYKPKKC